jgi:hypothetical protein
MGNSGVEEPFAFQQVGADVVKGGGEAVPSARRGVVVVASGS